MKIRIVINLKRFLLRVAETILVIFGIVRAVQYPDDMLTVLLFEFLGVSSAEFILLEDKEKIKEKRNEAFKLSEIIQKHSRLDEEDSMMCATYQLRGRANTDYQDVPVKELAFGMYFGVFKIPVDGDVDNWFTALMFVEQDEAYIFFADENRKIIIGEEAELVAVDMNSYVNLDEEIENWKEKLQQRGRDK